MYEFIDVTEVSEGAALPSEAFTINGEYIENKIAGYRTLNVSGREALSPELATYETGVRDGSVLQSKRYPARTLVVKYQLIAESSEAFREAYNKLAEVLNVQDAELIFNDESDKFLTGTPSSIGEVEAGRNSVVGEFEILCVDPFKYSVAEYEVEPTLDDGFGFLVNYNGTYKSYPTLEAMFYSEDESSEDGETENELTGNGDCGYVAFFNEREKIIQLGDPDEEDTTSYAKSQTLVNKSFESFSSYGTSAKSQWTSNNGTTSSDSVVQTGSFGLKKPAPNTSPNQYYLTPTAYGTGTKYHGPSATRTLPADAAGDIGASNFTFTYKQKMSIGSGKNDTKQCGAFQVLLLDGDGNIIAGVNVFKSATGKKGKLRFYVNGKTKETKEIDLSCHNKYFGNNTYEKGVLKKKTVKTSTIKKSGKTITFNIGGIKKTFNDSAVTNKAVRKITFTITAYSTKTPLAYNGIYYAKFVKDNCDTWRNIPNKFSANDVVVAECRTGEVLLNDAPAPELGALGNDWEEFYLTSGLNQLGCSYSDWVADAYAPTFKMRYREVFL